MHSFLEGNSIPSEERVMFFDSRLKDSLDTAFSNINPLFYNFSLEIVPFVLLVAEGKPDLKISELLI